MFLLRLIPLLWAPGLLGVLHLLGFSGAIASGFFALCVIAMFGLALVSARGTYKVREHARDMAPWAATVLFLAAWAGS